MYLSRDLIERQYGHLREKPFYPELLRFMTSSPAFAMVWEGPRAIGLIRATMGGTTDPLKAPPGTIRGDLAIDIGRNVIHSSDRTETANREIDLWFRPEELVAYEQALYPWLVEEADAN